MTPTPLVGSKSDRPGQPEPEAKEGGSKWRDKGEKTVRNARSRVDLGSELIGKSEFIPRCVTLIRSNSTLHTIGVLPSDKDGKEIRSEGKRLSRIVDRLPLAQSIPLLSFAWDRALALSVEIGGDPIRHAAYFGGSRACHLFVLRYLSWRLVRFAFDPRNRSSAHFGGFGCTKAKTEQRERQRSGGNEWVGFLACGGA